MAEKLLVVDLGLIDYQKAHSLQLKLVELRSKGKIPDILLLLEHEHVITLGRRLKSMDLKLPNVPVYKIERGGEATYHGPGQLVGYTIIDLEELGIDVWEYVWRIEEILIRTIKEFGLNGYRIKKYPGVWVNGRKIASIGLALSHWITYHGFALNVNTDLRYFKLIKPCGLSPEMMTSIQRELGRKIDLEKVKQLVAENFKEVLEYRELMKLEERAIKQMLEI
ncbi:MAG TPA: lipoyl(octanoyl) transferase LipB [Nitrososphaeria archaeon]|nr:MAG: lipoate-protein ligase B [Nitrososphaerota archaeon]HDJ67109.1 lipoyl(octanoyl) transferase LipB [Nitrososphaeria archaeon]